MNDVVAEENRNTKPRTVHGQTLKGLDLLWGLDIQDGTDLSRLYQSVDIHRFSLRPSHHAGIGHKLTHLAQLLSQGHPAHQVISKTLCFAATATSAKRNDRKE